MTTTTTAPLDQLIAAQQAAGTVAGAAASPVSTNSFVFFVGFDGTRNDRNNLAVSGAVDRLEAQFEQQACRIASMQTDDGDGVTDANDPVFDACARRLVA